jgi:hypothetical protein
MARAYGGLSQAQYDKLVQMKKMQQSQLSTRQIGSGGVSQLPISFAKNVSTTQMTSLNPLKGPKASGL